MLHFDYVAMHHRCRQLFSSTDLDCDVAGPKIKDLGASEMMLPAVVASILHQVDRIDVGRNAKDVVEREGEEETKKISRVSKRHGWLAKGI